MFFGRGARGVRLLAVEGEGWGCVDVWMCVCVGGPVMGFSKVWGKQHSGTCRGTAVQQCGHRTLRQLTRCCCRLTAVASLPRAVSTASPRPCLHPCTHSLTPPSSPPLPATADHCPRDGLCSSASFSPSLSFLPCVCVLGLLQHAHHARTQRTHTRTHARMVPVAVR